MQLTISTHPLLADGATTIIVSGKGKSFIAKVRYKSRTCKSNIYVIFFFIVANMRIVTTYT
jgi:hypothetical protein